MKRKTKSIFKENHLLHLYSLELTFAVISFGDYPSTVHPKVKHVPRTYLTDPSKVTELDLPSSSISLATLST